MWSPARHTNPGIEPRTRGSATGGPGSGPSPRTGAGPESDPGLTHDVQICCKGAREPHALVTEPRNHAVSSQPPGPRNGLCNRFRQPATLSAIHSTRPATFNEPERTRSGHRPDHGAVREENASRPAITWPPSGRGARMSRAASAAATRRWPTRPRTRRCSRGPSPRRSPRSRWCSSARCRWLRPAAGRCCRPLRRCRCPMSPDRGVAVLDPELNMIPSPIPVRAWAGTTRAQYELSGRI